MKNCLLYKYINRNFLKQVIVTSLLLSSAIVFLFLTVSDIKYSNENLGYIIFSLSILSFALLIFTSSVKGRRDNIINLNAIITKKEFDEVIIESTKNEFANSEKKRIEEIPHLLFFKAKGKIVFQMMLRQEDINGIYSFLRELNCNQNVSLLTDNKVNYHKQNYSNSCIPDVA
jgi:hypothetical protein